MVRVEPGLLLLLIRKGDPRRYAAAPRLRVGGVFLGVVLQAEAAGGQLRAGQG